MSYHECGSEEANETACPQAVELVITPRTGDIGGFEVKRALPAKDRRMVGPFVFWDQMGPGAFAPGKGLDVRPHPHIGLSTVTWLFDGSIGHKDSLGNDMVIQPGEVNLMTAGKGIVHSERSDPDARAGQSVLYGIQSWLALPKDQAEIDPAFYHYGASEMPKIEGSGYTGTVIMGEAYGASSPVIQHAPTLYVELRLEEGAELPVSDTYEERALYVVEGSIEIDDATFGASELVVLKPGEALTIRATAQSLVMLLGGAPMDGPRYIWWNFVSHDKERIKEAGKAWTARHFPEVPGDTEEFIPLPDMDVLDRMKL